MARVRIRLHPRASKDEIVGLNDAGVLTVRVTEPPVGGAANDRMVKLLAKTLRVSRSRITLISGARARNKTVEVEGFTEDELRTRWQRTVE